MSRLAIQVLFAVLFLAWAIYVAVDVFAHTFGDCADAACENYRGAARGLIFWRGLCVVILLILTYQFFRKDSDV